MYHRTRWRLSCCIAIMNKRSHQLARRRRADRPRNRGGGITYRKSSKVEPPRPSHRQESSKENTSSSTVIIWRLIITSTASVIKYIANGHPHLHYAVVQWLYQHATTLAVLVFMTAAFLSIAEAKYSFCDRRFRAACLWLAGLLTLLLGLNIH
jgi:hypothetical protein